MECVYAKEMARIVKTLEGIKTFDKAQKIMALEGVKKAVCDCNEVCNLYNKRLGGREWGK